jgi:hypothetical protein
MSIKSFVIAAAVAAGTFGLSDRADAQWRTYYTYPTYSYSYPVYSTYSYPTYTYSYPSYYNSSGVVTAGYTPSSGTYYTPYGTYYDPYAAGVYNAYVGGYSNVWGNPYGISVGTRGGMIGGRRAWRW